MIERFLVMAAFALRAEAATVPVILGMTGIAGFRLHDPVTLDRRAMATVAGQPLMRALQREIRCLVVVEIP